MTADNIAKQVDVGVHAPAFDAYNSFRSQYEQLQNCPSARAQAEPEAGLPESQLDKLSLVWLAQKNDHLHRDITREDLAAPQATPFDSLMAQHASKQYDAIKHGHFDSQGGWHLFQDKAAITRKDIDKSLNNVEQQRQSMDYADPLMADGGVLFATIAKVHDGVRSVNYWDLREARKLDDYEHSRGTQLFSDQQRAVIDSMYKNWSKGVMRNIEDVPQGSTMGCDGAITAESLARGTGFQNADEMKETFNQPLQLVTEAEYCRDSEAARQHKILHDARERWHVESEAIDKLSRYQVQPGQGFDRVARSVMTYENGKTPAEPDVVNYSKSIAQMNGYDRDTYDPKKKSLQAGDSIQVHDQDWVTAQRMEAAGQILDDVRESIDNKK